MTRSTEAMESKANRGARNESFEEWTPRQKSVAIALRNRYRRQRAPEEIREEILPNNILMIGPTGVGKTEIARRLARLSRAPFLKVEASKFTEVGYVGRDVESMIRDLAEIAVAMVRHEMADRVMNRARKHVEERLVNLLHPRHRRPAPDGEILEYEDWKQARDRTRQELRTGALDKRNVEIDVTERLGPQLDFLAQFGLDGVESSLAEAFESMMPQKKKRRRVSVAEARRILLQEETRRMVDMDEVTETALQRVQSSGIIFLDEIDKVCSTGGAKSGPDVSREGVQRDLLPIVEGSAVATRYGIVRTDHILFIAAGAFHTARPSDLVPELQGRLPIRVEMDDLSAEEFYRILQEPKNSLVRQYQALLAAEGVTLRFTDDALRGVASIAHSVNQATENIGARRLQTVLNTVLEDVLFGVPELDEKEIVIDRDQVERKLSGIARDKDLSSYIL
jgi:ATP-dependent HslUV protease ATP-binding subunit HslU